MVVYEDTSAAKAAIEWFNGEIYVCTRRVYPCIVTVYFIMEEQTRKVIIVVYVRILSTVQ